MPRAGLAHQLHDDLLVRVIMQKDVGFTLKRH
jgi:hypothetical protein